MALQMSDVPEESLENFQQLAHFFLISCSETALSWPNED